MKIDVETDHVHFKLLTEKDAVIADKEREPPPGFVAVNVTLIGYVPKSRVGSMAATLGDVTDAEPPLVGEFPSTVAKAIFYELVDKAADSRQVEQALETALDYLSPDIDADFDPS